MQVAADYRVFPWWPVDGNDWIHPQDVALVRRLIPSTRIFRREANAGRYLVLSYGRCRIRVLPAMRQAIRGEGFDLGDWVEVCSHLGKNLPQVGRIADMRWNARLQVIHYGLRRRNMTFARHYTADDLRHVDRDLTTGRIKGVLSLPARPSI